MRHLLTLHDQLTNFCKPVVSLSAIEGVNKQQNILIRIRSVSVTVSNKKNKNRSAVLSSLSGLIDQGQMNRVLITKRVSEN